MEIEPFRAPVPARGATAPREEEHVPSFTKELQDLLDSERRMDLDSMVILMNRQHEKWALVRELKAAELASV